jgi:hypothetical protein
MRKWAEVEGGDKDPSPRRPEVGMGRPLSLYSRERVGTTGFLFRGLKFNFYNYLHTNGDVSIQKFTRTLKELSLDLFGLH